MKMLSWPLAPLGISTLAIALFAAPSRIERPALVPISPGHALSVLDSLALLSLLIGVTWLYAGLWQRRQRLDHFVRQSPGVVFIAGAGLGLLIASAFSSFFWWWAIGTILFSATIIAAILGKDAQLMIPTIRKWYLLEAIVWTVEMFNTGRRSELAHGLAEITRELSEPWNGE